MKKIKLKKGIIALLIAVFLIFIAILSYNFSLSGYKSDSNNVYFTVNAGESKKQIIKELKDASLIRSKTSAYIYLLIHKNSLQAGTYEISRNMGTKSIINKFTKGDIYVKQISITLIEGKNMNDFISLLTSNFNYTEEEVKSSINDKDFLKSLIEKYDFLTDDILNGNIYYALEGYLFPDTYTFLENATVEDIVTTILNNTKVKLATIENDIENSSYSVHEILSMASIVELEAVTESDRSKVAQVIYKRLNMGKGLGMDVTTYYAVKKSLGEDLTMSDLRSTSLYNTSESNANMAGKLPVGPICNPSLTSIKAVLNPSDTDYIYFYANIKTHEVFFASTYEEFVEIQKEVG
jgi:UPF0755 protein